MKKIRGKGSTKTGSATDRHSLESLIYKKVKTLTKKLRITIPEPYMFYYLVHF